MQVSVSYTLNMYFNNLVFRQSTGTKAQLILIFKADFPPPPNPQGLNNGLCCLITMQISRLLTTGFHGKDMNMIYFVIKIFYDIGFEHLCIRITRESQGRLAFERCNGAHWVMTRWRYSMSIPAASTFFSASHAQPAWEPPVQASGLAEDPIWILLWVSGAGVEPRSWVSYRCPSESCALPAEARYWIAKDRSLLNQMEFGCNSDTTALQPGLFTQTNKQTLPLCLSFPIYGLEELHLWCGCVAPESSARHCHCRISDTEQVGVLWALLCLKTSWKPVWRLLKMGSWLH